MGSGQPSEFPSRAMGLGLSHFSEDFEEDIGSDDDMAQSFLGNAETQQSTWIEMWNEWFGCCWLVRGG